MYENSDSTAAPTTTSNGLGSDKKTDIAGNVRSNSSALMKLKSYVVALRVWSLSASMLPTILGETKKKIFFDLILV